MSTRKITKEQFSDNSTIDGSRIAKAIDDAVEYNNEVPLEAISKPRMPQFMVLGANPKNNTGAITISPPWLNYNLQDPVVATQQNFRAKGMAVSVTSAGGYITTDGGLWTVSTLFDRPVIIDTICVHIESWEGWPILLTQPVGSITSCSLLQLIVDTDNVHAPEDRTMNSKEFHYRFYDPTIWRASYLNDVLLAGSTDMAPARPTKLQDGTAQPAGYHSHVIEKKDMNLPIHQFARVRFRLGFGSPDTTNADKSWESGGSATMHAGQTTWVIVYREQARG